MHKYTHVHTKTGNSLAHTQGQRGEEVQSLIGGMLHSRRAFAPGEANPARLTENYSRDLEQPSLPTGPPVLAAARYTSTAGVEKHICSTYMCIC